MKVRMLSIMAGPQGVYDIGQLVDMPADKAKALIDGGYAKRHGDDEPVVTMPAVPEAAAIDHDAESAVLHPARKRRGG